MLLLDEATSALDTHSEQQVQQALAQLATADRTMVVVAHRLSTIRGMERIAVVHEGAVVEQGTHEQLASLPAGAYAQLMAMASQAEARATSEPSSSSSTREEKAALEDGALLTSPGSNTSAVVVLELHPVGVEEKAHAAVEEKAHAAALPEASDAKVLANRSSSTFFVLTLPAGDAGPCVVLCACRPTRNKTRNKSRSRQATWTCRSAACCA